MKKLTFLVVIVLLASLMIGCTPKATTVGQTTTVAAPTTTSAPAGQTTVAGGTTTAAPANTDKKIEITYLGSWMADIVEGNYIEKMIEQKLNVELKPVKSQNSGEQLSILVSANNLPDCMWVYTPGPSEFYYKQELVRSFPRELFEQYVPSFRKIYDKYPILWAQALSKDQKELIAIPGVSESVTNRMYLYADFLRYDWIKKLNIDIGVKAEKIDKNFYIAEGGIKKDVYRKILEGFVNSDPDGNGTKDTLGAVSITRGLAYPAFGFNNTDMTVNGTVDMYYAIPAYKEYLKFYQKLYQDNLLDKEIFTQQRNAAWEKVNKGLGGAWSSSTNAVNAWAIDRPPLTLIQANPDVELLMIPGLADDSGEFGDNGFQTPQNGWFYVNKKVTDEDKLIRILQFVEYACFGEDLPSMLYAEENVDWNMKDGVPTPIKSLLQGEKGTWSYGVEFAEVGDCWDWITMQPIFKAGAKYYVDGVWNKHLKSPARFDPLNETKYLEVNGEVGTKINDVVNTYHNNSVMKPDSIDATWDKYLTDLKEAGYDKLIAEIRKMPAYADLIKKFVK